MGNVKEAIQIVSFHMVMPPIINLALSPPSQGILGLNKANMFALIKLYFLFSAYFRSYIHLGKKIQGFPNSTAIWNDILLEVNIILIIFCILIIFIKYILKYFMLWHESFSWLIITVN